MVCRDKKWGVGAAVSQVHGWRVLLHPCFACCSTGRAAPVLVSFEPNFAGSVRDCKFCWVQHICNHGCGGVSSCSSCCCQPLFWRVLVQRLPCHVLLHSYACEQKQLADAVKFEFKRLLGS
ncbi:hypothetical protein COO60DRAFT_1300381, partial [Scenedesmus sp. NREL 46B-D3]